MPPFLEQLEAPYGAAVTALQPVRLVAPPGGALPTELPLPVHSLMALPLDGATRGMAGGVLLLANRSGGYEPGWEPLLEPLASALQKIHNFARGIPFETTERNPATAQMMIMNPLSGGGLRGLFSTHPSTEERVARLMAMAR